MNIMGIISTDTANLEPKYEGNFFTKSDNYRCIQNAIVENDRRIGIYQDIYTNELYVSYETRTGEILKRFPLNDIDGMAYKGV